MKKLIFGYGFGARSRSRSNLEAHHLELKMEGVLANPIQAHAAREGRAWKILVHR